jgi:hypothetical protein
MDAVPPGDARHRPWGRYCHLCVIQRLASYAPGSYNIVGMIRAHSASSDVAALVNTNRVFGGMECLVNHPAPQISGGIGICRGHRADGAGLSPGSRSCSTHVIEPMCGATSTGGCPTYASSRCGEPLGDRMVLTRRLTAAHASATTDSAPCCAASSTLACWGSIVDRQQYTEPIVEAHARRQANPRRRQHLALPAEIAPTAQCARLPIRALIR